MCEAGQVLGGPWQTAQGQSRLWWLLLPGGPSFPVGSARRAGHTRRGISCFDSPGRIPGHWAATGRQDAPPSLRQGKVPEGLSEQPWW